MDIAKTSKSEMSFSQKEKNCNNNNFQINDFLFQPHEKKYIKKTIKINKANNYIDSSGNFFSPNEFKELWETVLNIELIDLFDFCIKDYELISNLCQDILLLIYEESKIIINQKFSDVLKCLNLEKKSINKKNRIYNEFLPFFQENFNDIFLNIDSSLNILHNKLISTLNEYPSNNYKKILKKKIKENYFDNLIKNFYKICIYMLLHDPVLTFDLVKLPKRKLIYCFYKKDKFINVEGFGNDKSPCIIILPPPLIKNMLPFNGLKPAIYIISEPNENIIKECELNQNNNIDCTQKKESVRGAKTLTKNNINFKSEKNIYTAETLTGNNDKKLSKNIVDDNDFYTYLNSKKNNDKVINQHNKLSIKNNKKLDNFSVECKGVKSTDTAKGSKKELISNNCNSLDKIRVHHEKIINHIREINNGLLISNTRQNKLVEEKGIRQIKNKRLENYRKIKYNKKNNKFHEKNNNKLFDQNTSINNLIEINDILNNINSSFNSNNIKNNISFQFKEINKDIDNKKIKNSNSHNDISKIPKIKNNTNNYIKNMSYKSIPYKPYLKQRNKKMLLRCNENLNMCDHINQCKYNSENENIQNYICTNFGNNTNINLFNLNKMNTCLYKSGIKENLNSNKENIAVNHQKISNNTNNKNYYIKNKKENMKLKYCSVKNIDNKNTILIKNSFIDNEESKDINLDFDYSNNSISNGNIYRKYYNTIKSIHNANVNFIVNDNHRYGYGQNHKINKKLKTIENQRNNDNNKTRYKVKKNLQKNSSNNDLLLNKSYNVNENTNLIPNYFKYDDNKSEEIIQKLSTKKYLLNEHNLISYENKNN